MTRTIRHPLRESPYLRNVRVPYVAVVTEALSDELCDRLVARIEDVPLRP
jgi:hypothetical protein